MKLCATGHGRHYPRFREVHRAQVLLDGRPIADLEAVDTATGVAWRAKRDAAGNIVLAGDEIAIERITGSFRVESWQ